MTRRSNSAQPKLAEPRPSGAAEAGETGRVFVCLHGVGGAPSDWQAVTPALSEIGEVLALSVPRGPMDIARDAVLDEVPSDGRSVVVVGHSRGGVLALMVAAKAPGLVSGVVLASGYVPPNRAERSWVIGGGSWLKHRVRLAGRFVRGGHLTAPQANRDASFFTTLASVLQMAGVGLRPSVFDAMARQVTCPVLAITGGRDSHVPASWVGGAARRYGWSVTVIPEATHFAHVEHPADWTRAVREWLER